MEKFYNKRLDELFVSVIEHAKDIIDNLSNSGEDSNYTKVAIRGVLSTVCNKLAIEMVNKMIDGGRNTDMYITLCTYSYISKPIARLICFEKGVTMPVDLVVNSITNYIKHDIESRNGVYPDTIDYIEAIAKCR